MLNYEARKARRIKFKSKQTLSSWLRIRVMSKRAPPKDNPKNQPTPSAREIFEVSVSMHIKKDGKEIESKNVDFGKMREDQLKGLTDLFSMIASNVEYIRNLAPQYEKIGNSKPSYVV